MKEIDMALITGVDIPIPECQLIIHQPTLKEISMLGPEEYFAAIKCLIVQPLRDKENNLDLSSFQVFMMILQEDSGTDFKRLILNVLALLLPQYKVTITPRSLLLNFNKENVIIDENNFSSLQEVLRLISCVEDSVQSDFNPVNDEAAAIAQKLLRGRQRVAAQKQGTQTGYKVFSQYLSILSVGLKMPLNELVNLTVFQFYDLIDRYTLYTRWDLDIRAKLAGASSGNDEQIDWTKVIH